MIFQLWSALITNNRNSNAKCCSCVSESRGKNILMPSSSVLTSEECSSWVCYVQTRPPHHSHCLTSFTLGSCIVIVDKLTVIAGKCRFLLLYVTKWLCQNSFLFYYATRYYVPEDCNFHVQWCVHNLCYFAEKCNCSSLSTWLWWRAWWTDFVAVWSTPTCTRRCLSTSWWQAQRTCSRWKTALFYP